MATNQALVVMALVGFLSPPAWGGPVGQSAQQATAAEPVLEPAGGTSGKVVETMDSGGYTYVGVDTGEEQIWAAAPQFPVRVGDEVIVPDGVPMVDYYSKTLDREFDVVYFVPAVTVVGAERPVGALPQRHPPASVATKAPVDFSGLEKPKGGKTIAELFAEKDSLAGKPVLVRGKVVKFSAEIMGTNWIHIQDGTGAEGSNDLTVTSGVYAEVGDTILVRGVLTKDKDLGFGYRYDLIIEDAAVDRE